MARINILDDSTINKIAAGEVIERPSSIVKELVENSIDAGSTIITVEIQNGGKDLIKVVDNGYGIEHDDVNKAFMRHATSKINRAEDLYDLNSLGFRGEALASIAAVSKLEMLTKTNDALIGTNIKVDGGRIVSKKPSASNNGTKIVVNSLFFNTPARRKFLKSNQSETQAITDLMNKLAIGNPDIKFIYINNKKNVFETLGDGSIYNTIRLIYGKDVSDNLIKLDFESKFFKIDGYIANNNIYRSNRNLQHLFINGRYVKSSNIMNIINESYKAIIPINKFPVYFINLHINPNMIDVNIHPNKLEVKFDSEDILLGDLGDYIRGVLMKSSLIGKYNPKKETKSLFDKSRFAQYNDFSYSKEEQIKNDAEISERKEVSEGIYSSEKKSGITDSIDNNSNERSDQNIDINNSNFNADIIEESNIVNTTSSFSMLENFIESTENIKTAKNDSDINLYTDNVDNVETKEFSFLENEPAKNSDFKNLKFIGIIFDTYIIFSRGDEMIMVDQHAAHERVRFEEYMNKFKSNKVNIQMLIDPIIMDLSPGDMLKILANLDVFEQYGFLVEEFGHKNISIRGVPNVFGKPESQRFIYELIDNIDKIDNIYDTKYDEIAEIACKSAIKANDKIGYSEAVELIKQLEKCDNPYTCPHGRPVLVKMTKYDIEKMFKRIL